MTLDRLKEIPADAILGLMTAYHADPSPDKIDLTVGVYRDDSGKTPVVRAVHAAEKALSEIETSKAYLPPLGVQGFREGIRDLVLGTAGGGLADRAAVIQTPGGCGALRVGAEIYKRSGAGETVYLSQPTWGNHHGLLGAAGLHIQPYPYYDAKAHQLLTHEMLDALDAVPPRSLIVLQASLHNPTGQDPDDETWDRVLAIVEERDLLPFFDLAYQGLGEGLDEDVAVIRRAAEKLPELMVAVSCSKNFGLYRERTGALIAMAREPSHKAVMESQAANVARGIYSMAPAHGPLIVDLIFSDQALMADWERELGEMRERIKRLREEFAGALAERRPDLDFSWITGQKGMFSLLGLSQEQVDRLREEQHLYMVRDSRVNIAGMDDTNVARIAETLAPLMH